MKRDKQADGHKPSDIGMLAAVILILVASAAYVAGYFALSRVEQYSPWSPFGAIHARVFNSRWQTTLYAPAVKVEGYAAGHDIIVAYDSSGTPQ